MITTGDRYVLAAFRVDCTRALPASAIALIAALEEPREDGQGRRGGRRGLVSSGVTTVLFMIVVFALIGAGFFGAIGALLARSRGWPPGLGFAWGALLGPIGVIIILAATRGRRPTAWACNRRCRRASPVTGSTGGIGLDDLPD